MSEQYPRSRNQGSDRRRFYSRPKVCQFCSDKSIVVDYKQTDFLRRFIMDDGKIRPRRQTGTCAKHQRSLAKEIKRARHIALLPFTAPSMEEIYLIYHLHWIRSKYPEQGLPWQINPTTNP